MDEKDTNIKSKNLKIILLGESGVGKTSIISRYYMDKFDPEQPSTLGTTFITKKIVKNKIEYNLNIWDTTGQEKYHSVTKLFIHGANIVILVYAIDQIETLNKLDYWIQTIKDNCDNNVILSIVGNKYDLNYDDDNDDKKKKIVSDEEGETYAKEKNAIFKITSAKNDKKGIDSLFENLLDEYIKKVSGSNTTEKKEKNTQLDKKKVKKKEKKNNCCQN